MSELTTITVIVLTASVLLGLAAGLIFRVWINLIIAPALAMGSAFTLASYDSGLLRGIIVTFGCLVMSQMAYLLGTFMAPSGDFANHLSDDVLDDQPDPGGQHRITDKHQEKDGQDPSRSLPPET